jgi:hypothetical protein
MEIPQKPSAGGAKQTRPVSRFEKFVDRLTKLLIAGVLVAGAVLSAWGITHTVQREGLTHQILPPELLITNILDDRMLTSDSSLVSQQTQLQRRIDREKFIKSLVYKIIYNDLI